MQNESFNSNLINHWTPEEIAKMRTWMNETETNLTSLLLKIKTPKERVLAEQCLRRKKIKDKLPNWFECLELNLPPHINLEQSSSEITAKYKSELIPMAESFIDLTCGMGVDSSYLSKKFKQGFLVETNADLASLTQFNLSKLGCKNIQLVENSNAEIFIQNFESHADLIYIDPSRRDEKGSKTVLLQNYFPNVLELMPTLLDKASHLMVKTSPLLDIKSAISQLQYVSEIHILSVENECKELIFILQKEINSEPKVVASNLLKNQETQSYSFFYSEEEQTINSFEAPSNFLYEPNASIMKAGAFKSICDQFSVFKLNQHTHLYSSRELIQRFPGRAFKIIARSKVDSNALKEILPRLKANLTIRNFPSNVKELRKKLRLEEGGDVFVFATTLIGDQKALLICEKMY